MKVEGSQVRTYRVAECITFRSTKERFGGLSNMASGFPLEVNGIDILTAEALYQASRFPQRPDVQRLILRERSPMTAKMRGKRYLKETRSDWDRIRVSVMRWSLRVKLAQNWEKFEALLLETGDRPIVEDSRKDDFWGAKANPEGTLVGMNVLGRLLMELREQLRSPSKEQLRRAEPPSVPGFLLYGKPIGIVERRQREDHAFKGPLPITAQLKEAPSIDVSGRLSSRLPLEEKLVPEVAKAGWSKVMIPKECKRLAEVDFPIAEVSKHAAREKSIRHGHPSTLHLWWARRPLAACRAMLMGLLLPDPCDPLCPPEFKRRARELLGRMQQVGQEDDELRRSLLKFIGAFANWDASAEAAFLEVGRGLVRAAYPEGAPLVVDPFAGGGSIPLEALRLGCETFASDLNPVACLILKVLLEDIPRNGPSLAEELRRAGTQVKQAAEHELADFYPADPDGARPIAYLWARTVRCEAPNCGAEIPLLRSFWLCKKANRRRALRYHVARSKGTPLVVELEVFEPGNEKDLSPGTVSRARATCLCCGAVLPPDRVRSQLAAQRGGADVDFDAKGRRIGGARLVAVVAVKPGEQGRRYRTSTDADYWAIWRAKRRLQEVIVSPLSNGLNPVPDEPLPPVGTLGFRVQRYGVLNWGDLFTSRQKLALVTLSEGVRGQSRISRPLSLALGKLVDLANVICPWEPIAECPRNVLSNGRIKPSWDFAEGVPISDSSGSFQVCLENLISGVLSVKGIPNVGTSEIAAAQKSPLPTESTNVWFTDPPYYDAIPYSDLSDAFFVWYKRALKNDSSLSDPFDRSNPLTPKDQEIVQDEAKKVGGRPKDKAFFEHAMADAFSEGRRVLHDDGVGCVVFAHKTTEGWEALITGIIQGGLVVTGSWPIATEQAHRLRARDSAALATSVHLVFRPRPENAPVGDWGEVLKELPRRVGDWMERLQAEGIRGADLVFACIGPALEIFSRYSRVETPEGRAVELPEYLEKVWEVVGRLALEQVLGTAEARARNGAAGALEEDSRLTALFLWSLQSTGENEISNGMDEPEDQEGDDDDDGEDGGVQRKKPGYSLVFDVVRRFAQPLGIHLREWEGRIIETKKGVVRLLPVAERGQQLFGKDSADAVAERLERDPSQPIQLGLFGDTRGTAPQVLGRERGSRRSKPEVSDEALEARREATTLDRVHAAMLLQASGRANALRALLRAEQERGPDFIRLANALSALYPRGSEEKRLLDAMLVAVPR